MREEVVVFDDASPTGVRFDLNAARVRWLNDSTHIDDRFLVSLERYVTHGVQPGDFLSSVLANDLFAAIGHADLGGLASLIGLVRFIWNHLPAGCWGSWRAVNLWVARAGRLPRTRDLELLT